jgi:hypothetical protein
MAGIIKILTLLSFAVFSSSYELSDQTLAICKIAEAIPGLLTNSWGWKDCQTITNGEECSSSSVAPSTMVGFRGISCVTSSTATTTRIVEKLEISGSDLSGTLPYEIGLLTGLRHLNISNTLISGTIPPVVFSIKLEIIIMSGNLFSGGIPTEIGNIKELYSLDLSRNRLSGKVPLEISFINNSTTIDFPVDLSNNHITGTLPERLGRLVYRVNLANNRISGTLPDKFLSELYSADLSGNRLSGTISSAFSTFFPAMSANLSNNQFSGGLPSTVSSPFHSLDVSNNQISGTVPDSLTKNLLELIASNNYLSGSLPENLLHLRTLDLSNNQIFGSLRIPTGQMLMRLSLSNNKLSGVIPDRIVELTRLTFLNLSGNQLSGTIPRTLSTGLSFVRHLDLSRNLLDGSIAKGFLKSSAVLSYLNISSNNLSGVITDRSIFLDLPAGASIDISSNGWYGNCPPLPPFGVVTCNFGGSFYSGCPIDSKCTIEYLDNCYSGSGFYGTTCKPCNCSGAVYYCSDGVNGTGECILNDPCRNNTCEGNCIARGSSYSCSCTSPAILSVDEKSCLCPSGYYKGDKGSCLTCKPISNCFSGVTCSNALNSVCKDCENGYYLTEEGLCSKCDRVDNCFSIPTCSGRGSSYCQQCDHGYNQDDTGKCVINKDCVFDRWSAWSPCRECTGSITTRVRNLSTSNNSALPLYCQAFLTDYKDCGFPCVNTEIFSQDAIVSYLYRSFTEWDWLSSISHEELNISKIHESIVIENACGLTVESLTNHTLTILPLMLPSKIETKKSDCVITMNVKPDEQQNIKLYALGALALLIVPIISVIIYLKYRDRKWVERLPKDLHPYFEFKGSWEKHSGNAYLKKISRDSKDWELFLDIWSKLDTKDLKYEEVFAVYNPILGANFANHHELMRQRMIESPILFSKKDWILNQERSKLRTYIHEKYQQLAREFTWYEELTPIIPCVHGTDQSAADKIISQGFSALASLDAGFYGKGIYFTSSVKYAYPYFYNKNGPVVLVTLGSFGNAYPIVEAPTDVGNFLGKPIMSGYQSHYVLTKKDSGLPVTEMHTSNEYDELIASQEAQVVTIYMVTFRKSLQSLLKNDCYIEMSTFDRESDGMLGSKTR